MNNTKISSILLSLGLLLCTIGFLVNIISFWEAGIFKLTSSRHQYLIPGLSLVLIAAIFAKFKLGTLKLIPEVFSLGLIFFFFTDWLYNDYGLLKAPSIRGTIILFSILAAFCYLKKINFNWRLISFASILFLIINFLVESEGRNIFSDDHSTFLHRLILLKENFPNIPIYDPLWNGGYDQRYFFATGALNFFFINYIFLFFSDPAVVYNLCFLFVVFIILPISIYASGKLIELSPAARWISILLVMLPCTNWFNWTLKFGTMGFVTSACLVPLNLALAARILDTKKDISLFHALFFILTFTLMLFWSLSGIVFLPLILFALWKVLFQGLLKKNFVVFIILSLFVINIPWISVFWSVSNVGNFLTIEDSKKDETRSLVATKEEKKAKRFKHKQKDFNLKEVANIIREELSRYNPLILVFFLPGVFLIKRSYRMAYIYTAIWLFLAGTFLVSLKPQLELDRLMVILSLLAVTPAALAIEKVLNIQDKGNKAKQYVSLFLACITIAYLLASQLSHAEILRKRTVNHYTFRGEFTDKLVNAISNYQDKGRVLFSGCIIHEIEGGHLAPFTEFTDVPLIASSPVHNLWWYKQIYPHEYISRRSTGGIEEYLDLYNVAAVFAHEVGEREYLEEKKDEYRFVKNINGFSLFERINHKNNYFISGDGEVIEQKNSYLKLKLNSESAIIKFNYFPFLETSNCTIKPEKISENVTFIKLEQCKPGQEVLIKSKSAWERIELW